MSDKQVTLIDDFESYFRVELVTTDEQKEKVFNIRYRVYCEEFNYEATDLFPDKRETDEFDEHSLHCLIIHKATERAAGCVRLVPVDINYEEGLLPLEKFCKESLDLELIDSYQIKRNTVCEISRLAVDGAFRRRPGETATRFGGIDSIDCTKNEQRTFSLIALSAFLAGGALTYITHKTNVFAMMEPFLPRLLKRTGIVFDRVGSDMDYHGIRAPYFVTPQSAMDNIQPDIKDMYEWVYKQIEADYTKITKGK